MAAVLAQFKGFGIPDFCALFLSVHLNQPVAVVIGNIHIALFEQVQQLLRTPGRILPPCPAVVLPDGASFELLDGHRIIEAGRALGWEEATLLLVSVTGWVAADIAESRS